MSFVLNPQFPYYGNITLSSILSDPEAVTPFVKKYQIVETIEDVLVLSCVWYRLRQSGFIPETIENLLSSVLFKNIKPEDIELSKNIRDYYSKKLMMLTLRSTRGMSSFRKDLSAFLQSDGLKFTESVLPMVYRLPEFYHYDMEFDVIQRDFVKEIPAFTLHHTLFSRGIQHLLPIKALNKNTKYVKCVEYWLTDDTGCAYVIPLDPKNPLLPLWDREFTKAKINIQGKLHPKYRDNLQYYQLHSYGII